MGGGPVSSNVLFDSPGPKARRRSLIFSIIALVVVAAIVLWAILTLAAPRLSSGIKLPGSFDPSRWDIFSDPRVWRDIGLGVLATLEAAAVASVLALAIGVAFSLLRTSVFPWVRIPATVVLEFFRGMPVLLLMLFILLVSSFGTFWAVVLGLAVYHGAIIGEILRAGVASLPRGQREAGLSLGLTRLQTKSFIEYPQAFRQMLPVIVAQLVVLLKDTSLGYIVGYSEIIRTTMTQMLSFHGDRYKFSLYVITLVIYLGVNLSVSAFARRLARRRPAR
jgi:glutamate transport system permease protein